MSNNKSQATYEGGDLPSQPPRKVKKKKRIFMWFFLAVQLLFIVWLVTAINSTSGNADTGGVLTQEEANSARDAGAAIGTLMIFVIWAIVDFILAVGWAIVRLAGRR